MNRIGAALLLLLTIQLVVVGYVYRADRDSAGTREAPHLVGTGGYVVDEVQLEDREGHKALLQRRGDGWELPQLGGLPADAGRVEALLKTLTTEDPGWPVAHTLASRQRFQVAPYLYRLHVTLRAQERELGSAYLGSSPGYRKVHARGGGDDAIYSIRLNLFELPARADGWLDPDLLQVRAPLRITADGYSLERKSGKWLLGTGRAPDERELQALLQALTTLRLQGVASDEEAAAASGTEAALILQIVTLGGESTLEFFRVGDAHFVRSSRYPFLFKLSAYDFDKLTGIDSVLLSSAK